MERETLSGMGELARFETPKKVALVPHEFSVDRGELTPTLKVKRRAIDDHYRGLIDAVYADAELAGSAPVESH
jgi:long-chain acyl-CoA synthetase